MSSTTPSQLEHNAAEEEEEGEEEAGNVRSDVDVVPAGVAPPTTAVNASSAANAAPVAAVEKKKFARNDDVRTSRRLRTAAAARVRGTATAISATSGSSFPLTRCTLIGHVRPDMYGHVRSDMYDRPPVRCASGLCVLRHLFSLGVVVKEAVCRITRTGHCAQLVIVPFSLALAALRTT